LGPTFEAGKWNGKECQKLDCNFPNVFVVSIIAVMQNVR